MITYKIKGNIISDPAVITYEQVRQGIKTYTVELCMHGLDVDYAPQTVTVINGITKEKADNLIEDIFKQASNLRNFQHVMIYLDELISKYTE